MRPSVSIVIPTRNNLACLVPLLEAVLTTISPQDQVIVVINGSATEASAVAAYLERVYQHHTQLQLMNIAPQEGFSTACNAGMGAADKEWICLLNDDTMVPYRWLESTFECLDHARERMPSVRWGLIGPWSNCVVQVQDLTPVDPSCQDPGNIERINQKLRQLEGVVPYFKPVGMLSGFCLFIDRAVMTAVGPLDAETYGVGGFEDNDYLLRAHEAGFASMVAGKVFVWHRGHVTLDNYFPEMRRGFSNLLPFMEKWSRHHNRQKTCIAAYRVKIDDEYNMELLLRSLRRMQQLCDGAVVFDDRSPINIYNRIRAGGLDTFVRQYQRSLETDVNEIRDRQTCLDMARAEQPDWIWNLDHDEWPDEGLTRGRLQMLMRPRNPMIKAYTFPVCTFWRGETHIRVDRPWGPMALDTLFKNEPCWGGIRARMGNALHCRRIPDALPVDSLQPTQAVVIKHYGYSDYAQAVRKRRHYEEMDGEKNRALIGNSNYSHLEREHPLQLLPYTKPTLTYLLLARNELPLVSRRLLECVDWVDEFVVVDTGSSDRLAEVAAGLGARVLQYRCCANAMDPVHMLCDFAAARNWAIEQCATDYILFMDPDERLSSDAFPRMTRLLQHQQDCYHVEVRNHLGLHDQTVTTQQQRHVRLFRRLPALRYEGIVHESMEQAMNADENLEHLVVDGWWIDHEGFLLHVRSSPSRQWKEERYAEKLTAMMEKDPDDARVVQALAGVHTSRKEHDKAAQLLSQLVAKSPYFFQARCDLIFFLLRRAQELICATPPESIPFADKRQALEELLRDLRRHTDPGGGQL